MQKNHRLSRELAKLSQVPPPGISVWAKDDQLNILEAQIMGPKDSPYEEGIFNLEIKICESYPFSPPSITFLTKVYHPNIDDKGRICLDLIKMPPKGSWKPTFGIENLLVAVRMLLGSPNPHDPLMADIAEEYISNRSEFNKKAAAYCKMYSQK